MQIPNDTLARHILNKIVDTTPQFGPRKVEKSLALYGAGELGKLAADFCSHVNLDIEYVADRKADLYFDDPVWSSHRLLSLDQVLSLGKDTPELQQDVMLANCIATQPHSLISAELKKQGWQDVVPFYDIAEAYQEQYPLKNGWFADDLTDEDLTGMESVLCRWQDDVSRAHHLQFIAWHRLREDWIFDEALVDTSNRYFIPEIVSVLHEQEVFVDVGAHFGFVSKKFADIVQQRFSKIVMIEPDAHNAHQLKRNFESSLKEKQKVQLIETAVSHKAGQGAFYSGFNYASQLGRSGDQQVEIQTLDQLNIPATFIKVHLEGWEMLALNGALETIREYRPIITATCYHDKKGLWSFPAQLMALLHDYRFHFRLHAWMGTGAVVYGIPKERGRGLNNES